MISKHGIAKFSALAEPICLGWNFLCVKYSACGALFNLFLTDHRLFSSRVGLCAGQLGENLTQPCLFDERPTTPQGERVDYWRTPRRVSPVPVFFGLGVHWDKVLFSYWIGILKIGISKKDWRIFWWMRKNPCVLVLVCLFYHQGRNTDSPRNRVLIEQHSRLNTKCSVAKSSGDFPTQNCSKNWIIHLSGQKRWPLLGWGSRRRTCLRLRNVWCCYTCTQFCHTCAVQHTFKRTTFCRHAGTHIFSDTVREVKKTSFLSSGQGWVPQLWRAVQWPVLLCRERRSCTRLNVAPSAAQILGRTETCSRTVICVEDPRQGQLTVLVLPNSCCWTFPAKAHAWTRKPPRDSFYLYPGDVVHQYVLTLI